MLRLCFRRRHEAGVIDRARLQEVAEWLFSRHADAGEFAVIHIAFCQEGAESASVHVALSHLAGEIVAIDIHPVVLAGAGEDFFIFQHGNEMPILIDSVIPIDAHASPGTIADGFVAMMGAVVQARLPIDAEGLRRHCRRLR